MDLYKNSWLQVVLISLTSTIMILKMFALAFFIVNVHYCTSQQNSALPAVVSPAVIDGTTSGVCPSVEVMNAQRNVTKQKIQDLLRNTVNPELDHIYNGPPCSCGNRGEWTKIAFLNMTDPSQQCPTNWGLITSPVRACGRSTVGGQSILTCDSAFFPSNSRSYSHVCGRIIGYQKGSPDAFHPSISANSSLESAYIDGISLTHGAAGSRQHIWSFVSALYETDPNYESLTVCPCTNTNINWTHQVPSFVGNNYFCDTANTGPGFNTSSVYPDDPLWDGQGCGRTNACCEFNTPPWFCTTLPQPTSDDIELRICANQHRTDEDTLVNLIDIYIM